MDWLILSLATFIAAILQTVSGFGFGLLCVPVYLWVIDSIAAIQLVTIITLLMSIAILRSVKGEMVPALLGAFSLGCLIGSPIGISIMNNLDLEWIKIIAAIVILVLTLWNAYQYLSSRLFQQESKITPTHGSRVAKVSVGIASGALGASLAMPAPPVMLYLTSTAYTKNEIRSTILVYFIIAYGLALGAQMITQGITVQTWSSALSLGPVALLGVYIGHKLAPVVSPFYFRIIVFITLISTSIVMLISVLSRS